MVYLFGVENILFEYLIKVVFENVIVGIDEGVWIGVVGCNGDGKMMLFWLFVGCL